MAGPTILDFRVNRLPFFSLEALRKRALRSAKFLFLPVSEQFTEYFLVLRKHLSFLYSSLETISPISGLGALFAFLRVPRQVAACDANTQWLINSRILRSTLRNHGR